MTVRLVISLPKIPYIHCIYMVLANPNNIVMEVPRERTMAVHSVTQPSNNIVVEVSCEHPVAVYSFLFFLSPMKAVNKNHQFSASAVELEFLRSERRLRSGRHFA